jgi:hypothetical protein
VPDALAELPHVDAPEPRPQDLDDARRRLVPGARQRQRGRLAAAVGAEHHPALADPDV